MKKSKWATVSVRGYTRGYIQKKNNKYFVWSCNAEMTFETKEYDEALCFLVDAEENYLVEVTDA